jgi:ABC-type transport system involved in multi-copper enzyme maturation permease subunit
MAQVGRSFFASIVFTQLTLVLVAAPAATAGGIGHERARGNLAQLLITDLSDAEIVLGKLAARLVPVLGMVGCVLPVLALGTLLGGIDPLTLVGSFLITMGVAVLVSTITFTFSIWSSRPHEVLLATFAVLAIWLLSIPIWEFFTWLRGLPPLPTWALWTNPYILAFAPYARPGLVDFGTFLGFLAGTLAVSAALAALSIRRLRGVVIGEADRPATRRSGLAFFRLQIGEGPRLEDNPVLWYESHRKRHTAWTESLIWAYIGLAAGFSLLAVEDSVRAGNPFRGWFPAYVNAFQAVMGLAFLLVSATTALVEERARGSLDILLATPLSTRRIVLTKWWSVFRQLPLLLPLPTLVAATLVWEKGNWPICGLLVLFFVATGAAWTSIGLALSTWIERLGRALTAAVILYALVGLGLPMMALTLFAQNGPGGGLSSISPFYGTFNLTVAIDSPGYSQDILPWAAGWTLLHASAAVALLLATLATFDRRLGRIGDHASRGSVEPNSDAVALEPALVDLS